MTLHEQTLSSKKPDQKLMKQSFTAYEMLSFLTNQSLAFRFWLSSYK